jgi:site-specific DNA-methyltransferase (adenine-specific)
LINNYEILLGDSLQVLADIEDNSIDSIVTDPPYGLAFMNKKWDYDVPSVGLWEEVLRVLKPGGHLLSFGGTRTYHRMVVNIEDAGFEIRDQIQWLYGSGFPKSHNLSKAMDKKAGAKREVVGYTQGRSSPIHGGNQSVGIKDPITNPSTDLAKQWDGWGTALKPANEPIVLARKPLSEKTIVDNVLKWGTGGLNIDECRLEAQPRMPGNITPTEVSGRHGIYGKDKRTDRQLEYKKKHDDKPQGRWPANVILDEVAGEMLDEQSGVLKSGARDNSNNKPYSGPSGWKGTNVGNIFDSSTGGASRFFYCAKASKSERNAGLEGMEKKSSSNFGTIQEYSTNPEKQNFHPTVKPIKLMAYLCKLITPPNGVILDPFMGSGTTGIAAIGNGFRFVGIERESEYVEIAARRIENAEDLFNTTA